jgi:hypothetical protein
MGSWQVLSYPVPILPIHAALLNTGKVLFFAGSGNDPRNTSDQALRTGNAVWNVNAGTFTRPTVPDTASGHPPDLFCAGQSFRPDGQLMVAGGTLQYDPFHGLPIALFFNPSTEQWTFKPSMHNGRWYPALSTLGSGRIFALGGLDTNGGNNRQPEIYSPSFKNGWNAFPTSSDLPMYAHVVLLADGRLFFSGGSMGGNNGISPRTLTLPNSFSKKIVETAVSGLENAGASDQAATVLLPPAQSQQVMIMGGGSGGMAVTRVAIVDFTAATPAYTSARPLQYARMHLGAVLLPDRTVFVCNGSHMSEDADSSPLPAEVFDPTTSTWTAVEAPTVPRVYHSIALLLPDGRVLTAGGNPARGTNELRLELYSPSYMTRARPQITSAPSSARYGGTLTIQTPQANSIKWISLIRPSANTHSCDTEQRLVDVPIQSRTSSSVNATVPGNRNLAPPGDYMLFVTDNAGTPSTANWVRLG